MAYGFNDDKSKVDMYSKSEIDSKTSPNIFFLKGSVTIPSNSTYADVYIPFSNIPQFDENKLYMAYVMQSYTVLDKCLTNVDSMVAGLPAPQIAIRNDSSKDVTITISGSGGERRYYVVMFVEVPN